MHTRLTRYMTLACMSVILLAIPLIGEGCGAPEIPASSAAAEISSALVPNTDLDFYVYIKQANPTKVPKDLIGASADVTVESLSIWGIARGEDKLSIGGGLTFTSAADASRIYSQVQSQSRIWTFYSDRTIYFVQSLGDPGQNLMTAISKHDFKPYNDSQALEELAMMPGGSTTRPAALGVIKPNQTIVNLLKKYADANNAATIDSVFTWTKPQVITFGLYTSQQVDITDIMQRAMLNTIWDADVGVVASVKSAIPGFIVSPIASRYLDNAGYPKVSLGQLNVYKTSLQVRNRAIPAFISVEGNRVFVTLSGKESYAQTLMTGIKR